MRTPKIVFFDIDDTLYRKQTDTLRPSVAQAIEALKERGIITAIATGRTLAALPNKIRRLIEDAGIDLLVTINGQYISYRGEVLDKQPLGIDNIRGICAFLKSHHIPYAFVSEKTIAVSEEIPSVSEALSVILPNHPIDADYFMKHEVYQMLAFYGVEQDALVEPAIAEHGFKSIRWHKQSVDMLDAEGSKARGIALAIAKLGIAMQDVMAFGDGLNDIEMIETVGLGVAMGNAVPELKAIADYVCPSVEEDGVLVGLQRLGVIAD
ncbi:Cof-type HAD-IIB family hydrolase [Neisseria sp. S1]|uniref:Cof-type HAD-IIB family hydrolase n=1 Tax=Neisseria sp. S1 TaxID=3318354 RepID=UPI003A8710FF